MDISTKRILVTGGAGFIGSHIAEYLLKFGAKFVRVIDNLSTGTLNNITHLFQYDNFEFIEGTITDYDFCLKATDGIDIVCHQAAVTSVPKSIECPQEYHDINVTGFLNILNAAKNNNIKRIVYASSSAVYGDDINLKKQEDVLGKQLSPYATTKYIDEIYANMYTRLYGMECIGLRYFNVFGPRQDPNGAYAAAIPKFIQQLKKGVSPIIYGNGLQTRDFTYVVNIVNANFIGMTICNSECYGQAYNIGTGTATTVLDLVNNISNILDTNVTPIFVEKRNGDIEHSLADVNKAKKMLNWVPIVSFVDGISITIESFN
jgi:UDP-N-acetylglucosamine 4-epimerase